MKTKLNMAKPEDDKPKQEQLPKAADPINNTSNHNQIVTQPVQFSPYLESEEDAKIVAEMVKTGVKHHKQWNRRLKVFFCCLGYKKNKVSVQLAN